MSRILLALITAFFAVSDSLHAADRELPTAAALRRQNFERMWFAQVPLDRGRRVLDAAVSKEGLYVLGSDSIMTKFELNKGTMRWRGMIGGFGRFGFRPSVGEVGSIVISGTTISNFDREAGAMKWSFSLPFTPSTAATQDRDRAFVGASDGRVYAISSYSRYVDWYYQTNGRVESPPLRIGSYVVFASSDGRIYSSSPERRRIFWEFQTDGPISAPLEGYVASDRDYWVLAGSQDWSLYCLNVLDGSMNWEFMCGSPIFQRPWVVEKDVFVAARGNGLFRLDVQTGQERWHLPDAIRFIAASKDRVYVENPGKVITIHDRRTGKMLGELDVSPFDFVWENRYGENIYAGLENGTVYAIKDIDAIPIEKRKGNIFRMPDREQSRSPIARIVGKGSRSRAGGGKGPTVSTKGWKYKYELGMEVDYYGIVTVELNGFPDLGEDFSAFEFDLELRQLVIDEKDDKLTVAHIVAPILDLHRVKWPEALQVNKAVPPGPLPETFFLRDFTTVGEAPVEITAAEEGAEGGPAMPMIPGLGAASGPIEFDTVLFRLPPNAQNVGDQWKQSVGGDQGVTMEYTLGEQDKIKNFDVYKLGRQLVIPEMFQPIVPRALEVGYFSVSEGLLIRRQAQLEIKIGVLMKTIMGMMMGALGGGDLGGDGDGAEPGAGMSIPEEAAIVITLDMDVADVLKDLREERDFQISQKLLPVLDGINKQISKAEGIPEVDARTEVLEKVLSNLDDVLEDYPSHPFDRIVEGMRSRIETAAQENPPSFMSITASAGPPEVSPE